MRTYHIPVRNELTGEIRVVAILSDFKTDAQVEALCVLFRSDGWRKARALEPTLIELRATA